LVRDLRRTFPAWGKDKLGPILQSQGYRVSLSTVGRILAYLKGRGEIGPVPLRRASRRRRRKGRPWALPLPKGYRPKAPGELVQIDTLVVSPLPGATIRQITAQDLVSRWGVAQVCRRATAQATRGFLGQMLQRFPFPVQAIQVDGGSELGAQFEAECQRLGIKLFLTPPRSPQRQGQVERAQGTWRYEFYEAYDLPWTVSQLRPLVQAWEQVYNHLRPHQALRGRSPAQYLREEHPELGPHPLLSHMYGTSTRRAGPRARYGQAFSGGLGVVTWNDSLVARRTHGEGRGLARPGGGGR